MRIGIIRLIKVKSIYSKVWINWVYLKNRLVREVYRVVICR